MLIIQAEMTHLDLLVPLFDAYRVFYRAPRDSDGARAFLSRRLEQEESVIYLALPIPAAATPAMGFVQLYPCFSSVSMAPIWILNDLFVAEHARGEGFGGQLLGHARAHAETTGALRLELSTEHTNSNAQRLYERNGYQLDEQFRKYLLPLGKA